MTSVNWNTKNIQNGSGNSVSTFFFFIKFDLTGPFCCCCCCCWVRNIISTMNLGYCVFPFLKLFNSPKTIQNQNSRNDFFMSRHIKIEFRRHDGTWRWLFSFSLYNNHSFKTKIICFVILFCVQTSATLYGWPLTSDSARCCASCGSSWSIIRPCSRLNS